MAKKKPYAVRCEAPDGNDVTRFSTLAEAGSYLKQYWQGADYMRGNSHVGTDYANFYAEGFLLTDVGEFSYHDGYREYEFFDWCDVSPAPEDDYHLAEHNEVEQPPF